MIHIKGDLKRLLCAKTVETLFAHHKIILTPSCWYGKRGLLMFHDSLWDHRISTEWIWSNRSNNDILSKVNQLKNKRPSEGHYYMWNPQVLVEGCLYSEAVNKQREKEKINPIVIISDKTRRCGNRHAWTSLSHTVHLSHTQTPVQTHTSA